MLIIYLLVKCEAECCSQLTKVKLVHNLHVIQQLTCVLENEATKKLRKSLHLMTGNFQLMGENLYLTTQDPHFYSRELHFSRQNATS